MKDEAFVITCYEGMPEREARMKDPITIHQEKWYEMGREGEIIPIICCDCGLTHEWEIDIQDGVVLMRCIVDKRTTSRIRRRGDAELFGKSTEYEIVAKKRAKN